MVRSTDRPAMTIAVDLGRKATKQTNKEGNLLVDPSWTFCHAECKAYRRILSDNLMCESFQDLFLKSGF